MSERDDLHGLLSHPGWLAFKKSAESYWRDQHDRHVAQAANETDDVAALNKLRQVIAAKEAVMSLLQWPEQRLRSIDARTVGEQAQNSLSRGGYASTR